MKTIIKNVFFWTFILLLGIFLLIAPQYVCVFAKNYMVSRENANEVQKENFWVYYAGRLDKDSEGLLLLTNQGDLVNEIMKAGNFHEKEYLVTVDRPVTEEFLQKIRTGVPVLGTITRPSDGKSFLVTWCSK